MSEEEKVAHAWVAACEAGHLKVVELLLPVVEHTSLGVNCTDGAGVTGLMAALEKGRLEVVDLLLDHKDTNLDCTQTDAKGRNLLDMAIYSPGDYFMTLILDGLQANLVGGDELDKMLLPRLLSCVTLGKLKKFKKMLQYFDLNFKEGALLSFLIISGEAKFIAALGVYCSKYNKLAITYTNLHKKSLLHAIGKGRGRVVQSLFSNFPSIFKSQLFENVRKIEAVKREIFTAMRNMIKSSCRSCLDQICEVGVKCVNINKRDEYGFTLLMIAVDFACLPAVRFLLNQKTLDVNIFNHEGYRAIDLIPCHEEEKIVHLFLERQAVCKDVDFKNVELPLLTISLGAQKFDDDLICSLLDNPSYTPSASELSTARDILALKKRLLISSREKFFGSQKDTLLKVMHKVEVKKIGNGNSLRNR